MSRRVLITIFILLLAIPTLVQAQEGVSLTALEVDLWPEYDRAEMLVIYRATLSPEISLPVNVTFRVPAIAGEPNAVAVRQMDGALLNATYERRVEGEWALVTLTATMPDIQLEYYDPRLEKEGTGRHFEYYWPGDYSVESLIVIVQQPVGASEMRIEPDLGEFVPGSDGMAYYNFEVGSITAGQDLRVILDYQKDTDTLTVEGMQVQPSAPITEDTTGHFNFITVLPWVLAIIGVVLLVLGAWWFWRTGREQAAPSTRRVKRGRRSGRQTGEISMGDDIEAIYCHQCGKRASTGDRFCRACGTKLRG
jgi:hypothetical protein